MEILNLYPGSFGANCYCLFDGGDAIVIDPSTDADTILREINQRGAVLRMILLTHGHFDHVLSADRLRDMTGAPLLIHNEDAEMLTDANKNAFRYFFGSDRVWRAAERTLTDGETITLGDTVITVVHTPGHSKGSVCYLTDKDAVFTGDTLFGGDIGRCDLWGGDESELFRSLQKLRKLSPKLTIYPGHGASALLSDALDVWIP